MFHRIYGGIHHHPAAVMQNEPEATTSFGGGHLFMFAIFFSIVYDV